MTRRVTSRTASGDDALQAFVGPVSESTSGASSWGAVGFMRPTSADKGAETMTSPILVLQQLIRTETSLSPTFQVIE